MCLGSSKEKSHVKNQLEGNGGKGSVAVSLSPSLDSPSWSPSGSPVACAFSTGGLLTGRSGWLFVGEREGLVEDAVSLFMTRVSGRTALNPSICRMSGENGV